jgi:hypothetical protein
MVYFGVRKFQLVRLPVQFFYLLRVAYEPDPALLRVNRRQKESKDIPPHVG